MQKVTASTQVATKSDIKRLEQSTKSDIKRLEQSTKSDIKRLEQSTKSEIQRLATKRDLKSLEEKIEAKLDKIANTLDGFVGTVDNLRIENEVGANQIRDLRELTDDHETRITKLESTTS